jgi:glycosyltransferase involved in cell wall biosynthesis
VLPEITGLMIPPGHPDAIYEAVMKLIRDPQRRRLMGQSARAWILEHYVESRVVGMTVDYYKSLLDDRIVTALQSA